MNRLIYLLSLLILVFQSCSSDNSSSTTNPTTTSGFYWKENGGAEIKADSAYYDSQYKTIKAFKNYTDATNAKFIEINLTAGTAGTYTVSNSNAISFLHSSLLYVATSGSITITENISSKMTGNFVSTATNGSVTALEGNFKSIEVR